MCLKWLGGDTFIINMWKLLIALQCSIWQLPLLHIYTYRWLWRMYHSMEKVYPCCHHFHLIEFVVSKSPLKVHYNYCWRAYVSSTSNHWCTYLKEVFWVLCFLIFVNNIPSSIKYSHVFLCEDDAKCLKKYVPHPTAIYSKMTFLACLVGAYSGICALMKQNVLYSDSVPNFLVFSLTILLTILQFKFPNIIDILEF